MPNPKKPIDEKNYILDLQFLAKAIFRNMKSEINQNQYVMAKIGAPKTFRAAPQLLTEDPQTITIESYEKMLQKMKMIGNCIWIIYFLN